MEPSSSTINVGLVRHLFRPFNMTVLTPRFIYIYNRKHHNPRTQFGRTLVPKDLLAPFCIIVLSCCFMDHSYLVILDQESLSRHKRCSPLAVASRISSIDALEVNWIPHLRQCPVPVFVWL
ncbi:hypothetical protein Nepgr_023773 [Nepenthes gracilis]|uniref:Uncharacterized protein n=1 Tax=Nepenthes gracilis TaxID=150966 RepID=A0AAD3XZF0_NEPGR|nr:hypothetical protein Nepgr_023773 [Nepenthes gracilis]